MGDCTSPRRQFRSSNQRGLVTSYNFDLYGYESRCLSRILQGRVRAKVVLIWITAVIVVLTLFLTTTLKQTRGRGASVYLRNFGLPLPAVLSSSPPPFSGGIPRITPPAIAGHLGTA